MNWTNYRKVIVSVLGIIVAVSAANIAGAPSWVPVAGSIASSILVLCVPNKDKKAAE